MTRTRPTRSGVTLVELMVAAAMCIMGMWLLSWLYQQGLESFRQARAQADLTNQQRMFTQIITRDLAAPRFEREDGKPNGGTKLSDQRLDQTYLAPDPTNPTQFILGGYTAPKRGYFRAGSFPIDGTNNKLEVADLIADSSISTNHYLQFTAILPGGSNFQQFSAEVSAGSGTQYFGTAAEITYYLKPSGTTLGGFQLYDLYRSQRLVARNKDDVRAYQPAINTNDPTGRSVMAIRDDNKIAKLADLTIPQGFSIPAELPDNPAPVQSARFPAPFTPNATGARFAEDKLMSSVISFEVKFTGTPSPLLQTANTPPIVWPRPLAQNTDYPYDTLPFDGQFDTFSTQLDFPTATPPRKWNSVSHVAGNAAGFGGDAAPIKPIRITGVQIRLRTYDSKTRSARQTTLILDL